MKVVKVAIVALVMMSIVVHQVSAQFGRRRGATEGRSTASREWIEQSVHVGGLTRWYRVYVPPLVSRNVPVVMVLHGGTQSMRDIFADNAGGTRRWRPLADSARFILVAPNGVNPKTGDPAGDHQTWNDGRTGLQSPAFVQDDVAFLSTLVSLVTSQYGGDPARVFLTGVSNGGHMTQRLIVEKPDLFAAAAVFIANTQTWITQAQTPSNSAPMLFMLGTEDRLNKFAGGVGLKGVETVSAADTEAYWVKRNQARPSGPLLRLPDRSPEDGCRVFLARHQASRRGFPVHFYVLEGAGHSMPSMRYSIPTTLWAKAIFGRQCMDLEGADTAWQFFVQYGKHKTGLMDLKR